ncbi:DUF2513 domain-containing protein [Caproiciproducens galactitolivorans]|uniref:DUF2513 domain-containing protein n=1 Tax=Caproiciproducens galactitolivorans TaxID=642589 RepID=A0A4Z0YEV3_9FIRM|nr:DUF2513 domain-containing protein [Caproiciproducens galactitolivorans]QEY33725.1 DUF2513 domain-containing protein [Caproiciproducens galactitolivorans]TGJ75492.1 hypothetical protein CAGA_23710 [Caproiciproducens galactitolivorans]
MKLNPDCIRDILLAVEENTGYRKELQISRALPLPEQLQKYDFETVAYHAKQCIMAGLLVKGHPFLRVEIPIADLTPAGHDFLANIRADTNWNRVKQKAKSVGSESLSILIQIASQVITSMLTQLHGF